MKNGTSLLLTELLVMLLVFSAAAACCLQIFSWTDRQMTALERKDEAAAQAQNFAEKIRSMRGNWPEDDEQNGIQEEIYMEMENGMTLSATRLDSGIPGLGKAEIQVREADGSVQISLPVCWQEALP
ncbi:MAG: hypothetical protein PUE84_09200 [Firmicutes bacterium]|nr:hypothetical protein [Bacillota bacterium]